MSSAFHGTTLGDPEAVAAARERRAERHRSRDAQFAPVVLWERCIREPARPGGEARWEAYDVPATALIEAAHEADSKGTVTITLAKRADGAEGEEEEEEEEEDDMEADGADGRGSDRIGKFIVHFDGPTGSMEETSLRTSMSRRVRRREEDRSEALAAFEATRTSRFLTKKWTCRHCKSEQPTAAGNACIKCGRVNMSRE
jgi:hypothetical protein